MAAQISQKEYLKKYLNIGSDKKKTKKKKKKAEVASKFPRTRILDDDIDLKSLISKENESGEEEKEDAPVVAEIIDDRPESLKRNDFFKSSQWKIVGSTGDIYQPLESVEVKSSATIKQKETVRSEHSSPSKVRSIGQSNRSSLDSDKPSSRPTSTQTKRRHDSDSDQSPPRLSVQSKIRRNSDCDQSPPRSSSQTRRRHDSDSDQSLSRVPEVTQNKKRQILESENKISKRNKKGKNINEENFEKQRSSETSQSRTKPRHGSGSDQSPPRLKERHDTNSPLLSPKHSVKEKGRLDLTLSGMKAGLQDATCLKDEIREFKKHEDEMMKMIGDKMSGKGAETIFRDRATGKKRDLKEEKRKQRQEEQKKAEVEEKYMEWGKGLKQKEQQHLRVEEDLYEMSKPLARYVDDPDLERELKEQEREGDPMLAFIRKKKSKEKGKSTSRPIYQGPPPPPNRFGIMPGYRWDGVDRSNGFEKRCFEKVASKKALDEEAYKWSVGDM
ncbi:BUD13 homolog isoform X2 [Limulus polyphemus]|uniref:BUD13 homolog n=1 Tax=Limulus polyphemus TaxID=6850 RepID=A0ABM1RVW2_LIMPO|nr:BUD13 homolog isoform X2 [Limulus polyphemus]